MRKYFLLLFVAMLIGCEASTSVQNEPGLVITAESPATAGESIQLTATLTPADPEARYYWDIIGFEYDTTAVIFHTFPLPGNYRVICYARSPDSTILGVDTITVNVIAQVVTLNMQTLQRFEHVDVVFVGDHRSTFTDTSGSREIRSDFIGLSLDASGGKWNWQNGKLVYDHLYHHFDTIPSSSPEAYHQLDSTEHLDVTITGNTLKSLTASRSTLHHEFENTGKTLDKSYFETALTVSDLVPIFQSTDSIVFMYMGQSLKDHVIAKDQHQSIRLSTKRDDQGAYDSTSWSGSVASYTRVRFY